jgi:hypothetical protein
VVDKPTPQPLSAVCLTDAGRFVRYGRRPVAVIGLLDAIFGRRRRRTLSLAIRTRRIGCKRVFTGRPVAFLLMRTQPLGPRQHIYERVLKPTRDVAITARTQGPYTGHHRPAPSVSIISGCVRVPVHIVVEDHHDALGQRDRFQLRDSFGGRTLRVEQGWDDRVNGATDVINQHIEVVVHLA